MNKYCIVTTINKPTKAIEKLHYYFGRYLLVVADKKTPADWQYKDTTLIPFDGSEPQNHYARKNIGYLNAIKSGATLIYDTDDDNIPNDNWTFRGNVVMPHKTIGGWCNVYNCFTDKQIWPRGFPLKDLHTRAFKSSIQQGLSDIEPDVDAVWRLVFNDQVTFTVSKSVYLKKGAWCPFNSQSTWWFPKAFPLMYLPVYSTFRMTDIWRSFVAQRCLWELGEGVTFHSPSEVYQDRNEHDLLKDFEDEIPGYLNNDLIVETLEALTLKPGEENVCSNILTCYQSIVDKGILPPEEIDSLKEWIKDYEAIAANMG